MDTIPVGAVQRNACAYCGGWVPSVGTSSVNPTTTEPSAEASVASLRVSEACGKAPRAVAIGPASPKVQIVASPLG